ncbi:Aste57867_19957 [Aphanomyces stellatus]|uniref:Aste57867_19957 protein n=1 Tax=Aphanomyces stellatus TaxID=120398 RepID=A0A485LDV4_9STRA|nr:hypothetical protein As57867_019891 [Aphanomyces stellatus]VFT96654.1 Aste57867_19957 [Aphanomyces stellatus]
MASNNNNVHKLCYKYEHLKSKREWVEDKARAYCAVCTKKFFLGGKHHCRRCGEVICKNCAPFVPAVLPGLGRTKLRVCVKCVDQDHGKEEFLSESSSSSDEETEEELIKKSELMLFSPNAKVMERAYLKAEKLKSLYDDDDRTTTASVLSVDSVSSAGSTSSKKSRGGFFGRDI